MGLLCTYSSKLYYEGQSYKGHGLNEKDLYSAGYPAVTQFPGVRNLPRSDSGETTPLQLTRRHQSTLFPNRLTPVKSTQRLYGAPVQSCLPFVGK